MSMKRITTDDLRRMDDQEGLILQGCGGDLQEWVDGINELLTQAGVLLDGSRFKDVAAFEYDGMTCLYFPFGEEKLDMGRFAMWRLQTHAQFGGTWLSDYVPNRLGGFMTEQQPQKPAMELVGQDGNIFGIVGRAANLLRQTGQSAQAKEMTGRVFDAHSYDEALRIISEYVDTELSVAVETKKQKHKKEKNAYER
jgi:hypothetical protein